MKRLMMIMFAIGAAALAGCASSPVQPMDTRVTVAPGLYGDLYVSDVRCVKGGSGVLTMQANVVNNTSSQLRLQWRVQWLDADGMEIETIVSTWSDVAVQPYAIKGLKSTGPGPDAVDMRLYLRKMP